jgi:flagellar basal-body rod protein FlgG
MIRALYTSASGMQAQQMNLDVIANNLANVNTTGFKKSKIEFQDLLYQASRMAGTEQGAGNQLPAGVEVGHGTRTVSTARQFTNGEMTQTGGNLDLAVMGDGMFEVELPDGSRGYTRDGAFKVSAAGRVVTSDGYAVTGFPAIPPGVTNITIANNGTVTLSTAGGSQSSRLQMARFPNPSGLSSMGRNMYKETPASGAPETGQPAENGFGEVNQGYLELSNVKVVEEMVNLIMAQRAYEVNTKAIAAADEMMQQSNNLKR